jgi:DNA mismatch repair protein MutS2
VLADIGDHQSLSANLSTFSSHISNIAEMLRECESPALVLLDEVGTGTDPDEGSALGVAIVDEFREKHRAQIIASTHYRGLKIYATNNDFVVNASVEFDEKTLRPTYRLLTGLAGASSGIEIARRFGIPQNVIEVARENVETSARDAADFLSKIKRESQVAEDTRRALEDERETVARKFASLDIEFRTKEKKRQKEFEDELAQNLEGFERQVRASIENIEDKAARAKLEKEIAKQKAELKRTAISKLSDSTDFERQIGGGDEEKDAEARALAKAQVVFADSKENIAVGSQVYVSSYGKVGKIEKLANGIAEILVGSMRLREKIENLRPVVETNPKKNSRAENLQKKSQHANLRLDENETAIEINLIGKKTSVVDTEVDRFLDEAFMSGHTQVRIIHGMGTGALRNAVHDFLRNHPHVERYALAPREQGGDGATVVELKS